MHADPAVVVGERARLLVVLRQCETNLSSQTPILPLLARAIVIDPSAH